MKVCPNCETKIKSKKITELSYQSDLIKCKNCGAFIKPNELYLQNKNSIIDWIGMLLIPFGLNTYDISKVISIIIISIGLGLYLFGLRRYLKSVKLNTIAITDQDPMNVFTGEKGDVEEVDEIESYKRMFKLWSVQRLKEVLEINKWSKTAKIAAKQLLKEKTKT